MGSMFWTACFIMVVLPCAGELLQEICRQHSDGVTWRRRVKDDMFRACTTKHPQRLVRITDVCCLHDDQASVHSHVFSVPYSSK
jgi:hypothetical protein